jgi:hypothetical protein
MIYVAEIVIQNVFLEVLALLSLLTFLISATKFKQNTIAKIGFKKRAASRKNSTLRPPYL